ncbi:MAG: phosphoribosylformylglycinamidine cyclo-ligase [Bacteroidetes bacterium]|nr:phosphoribosylformylglycinamidine cyclo-ligase [Bacteroidota bacterium]
MNKYAKRGVSSDKTDVHKAISKLDKGIFPNAFCKVVPDIMGGDDDFCNVVHADGAGTKSSLAYIYWKETGDLNVWKGIAQDAIVMNTDDMLCLGLTDNFLLSSTIGRNKNLIPGEVISAIIEGTEEFISNMRDYGVNIISTGGETADVGDLVRTVIVDSTMSSRARRSDIIENRIKPGDVIVGLASYGQSKYESEYNAGMGSNGLTSARHDIFSSVYRDKYPESYDPMVDKELVYSGSYKLTDIVEDMPVTMGKAVLSPTRTFAPVVREVLKNLSGEIHGMIHNTGGGQTKVIRFIENLLVVKDNLLPIPPLFNYIAKESGSSPKEMMEVFNMGTRLEFYVEPERASEIIEIAHSFGIDAGIVGFCEKSDGRKLEVSNNSITHRWDMK